MNPLGGLFKITAAVAIAWLWARGTLTPLILDTIGAFTTPPAPTAASSSGAPLGGLIGGAAGAAFAHPAPGTTSGAAGGGF